MWRAADFWIGVGYALSDLGRVVFPRRPPADATELLDRARATFRQMSADAELVETDARRAECLLLQGSAPRRCLADDAVVRAHSLTVPSRCRCSQRIRGFALLQLGRPRRPAREAFERSLAGARELEAVFEVALTLDAIVRL